MLDQIKRQDKAVSYEAFGTQGLQRGLSFNTYIKTLVVWSFYLEKNNPRLIDVQDIVQGIVIILTMDSTTSCDIISALKNISFFNEAKVGKIKDKLAQTF